MKLSLKDNIRYVRRLCALKHLTKKQLYFLDDTLSNKHKYNQEDKE